MFMWKNILPNVYIFYKKKTPIFQGLLYYLGLRYVCQLEIILWIDFMYNGLDGKNSL